MYLLVAEDNPDLVANLCDFLQDRGHVVDVAYDGPTGLRSGMDRRYDAVVLDLMLPGMDGLDVCRRWRHARREMPVMMLTARDTLENKLEGFDSGTEFYETIHLLFARAGEINPYVTAVGAITVVAGILIKKFAPRFPYMIGAMLLGSVLAVVLDRMFGAANTAIPTVGALPASLPPLSMPDVSLGTIRELAPAALAVTLFALTEAVSISRSLALRAGQQLDGNQEFIGQGLSNIAGGFFSA